MLSRLAASLKGSGFDEEFLDESGKSESEESDAFEFDNVCNPRTFTVWECIWGWAREAGLVSISVPATVSEGVFDFIEVYSHWLWCTVS